VERVQAAERLKEHGVSNIICTSVADAFVMRAWGKAVGSGDVQMLSDGNAEYVQVSW
jgi:peroxiredoxin